MLNPQFCQKGTNVTDVTLWELLKSAPSCGKYVVQVVHVVQVPQKRSFTCNSCAGPNFFWTGAQPVKEKFVFQIFITGNMNEYIYTRVFRNSTFSEIKLAEPTNHQP